MQKKQ